MKRGCGASARGGLRVQGPGSRVQGPGFRVQGSYYCKASPHPYPSVMLDSMGIAALLDWSPV